MAYSQKRQSFLVNQGYAYKIINKIPAMDSEPGLSLGTPDEQARLLQQVLQASDKDLEEEESKADEDSNGKKKVSNYLLN